MHSVTSLAELPALGIERITLTCGVFDGLHRGHQQLIEIACREAERTNAVPVVFSFDPHPARVLAPATAPKLLISNRHKLTLLADLGVAATVLMPFCHEIAAIEANDFLTHNLFGDGPEVTAVVVGEHWRFGRGAEGTVSTMHHLADRHGIKVIGVPEFEEDGAVISSTRIRRALREGDLRSVERLLGRPFSIMGEVYHGRGIGDSELHYPTANVRADNEVFPPAGIYAATTRIRNGDPGPLRQGILYLGNSPTFVDQPPDKPFVEMHIFDFHEDIYGRFIDVQFNGFIRPDARFDSVQALCQQIGRDIEVARQMHAARG